MNLLGQKLQQAGLNFISAKARHHASGMRIDEIVCATSSDVAAVDAWAEKEGYPVKARVATTEELDDYKEVE